MNCKIESSLNIKGPENNLDLNYKYAFKIHLKIKQALSGFRSNPSSGAKVAFRSNSKKSADLIFLFYLRH